MIGFKAASVWKMPHFKTLEPFADPTSNDPKPYTLPRAFTARNSRWEAAGAAALELAGAAFMGVLASPPLQLLRIPHPRNAGEGWRARLSREG